VSDTITTRSVVLDCPDPQALAQFYSDILDRPITYADDEWVVVTDSASSMRIAFQKVPNYTLPTWPEGPVPQQFHLDFTVDEFEATEKRVLAAGATRAEVQPGEDFVVFCDPAGHPFCLCL
jgi:catechol 2,3-dioxygenase-like lactoylglutathione lyase family enzyme